MLYFRERPDETFHHIVRCHTRLTKTPGGYLMERSHSAMPVDHGFGVLRAQRNPMSLRRAAGGYAFRLVDASTVGLLFQAPPRSTRNGPMDGPDGLRSGLF